MSKNAKQTLEEKFKERLKQKGLGLHVSLEPPSSAPIQINKNHSASSAYKVFISVILDAK